MTPQAALVWFPPMCTRILSSSFPDLTFWSAHGFLHFCTHPWVYLSIFLIFTCLPLLITSSFPWPSSQYLHSTIPPIVTFYNISNSFLSRFINAAREAIWKFEHLPSVVVAHHPVLVSLSPITLHPPVISHPLFVAHISQLSTSVYCNI